MKIAVENRNYVTTPNSTHMMHFLDVDVYGSLNTGHHAAEEIDGYALAVNIMNNLRSSFRTASLYPVDHEPVLEKLPADCSVDTGRVLNRGLLEFLKETRGYNFIQRFDTEDERKSFINLAQNHLL